jgi:hypothetical protein
MTPSALACGRVNHQVPVPLGGISGGHNGGAMLDWAVYRKGSLAAWLRRSLEGLLAPYRLGAEADLPKARTGRMQNNRR